jgi:hypothetical protein
VPLVADPKGLALDRELLANLGHGREYAPSLSAWLAEESCAFENPNLTVGSYVRVWRPWNFPVF